ncbi:DUF4148 domain-containing protein [Burkholderia latens]|uniref:DUF4148 domain-containing protein n=1 Tax=Burkholderia latens TaxID=488446 RepID=UPI001FC84C00|nr:DUF4148 domain-containing protein [Burkholderia latens]
MTPKRSRTHSAYTPENTHPLSIIPVAIRRCNREPRIGGTCASSISSHARRLTILRRGSGRKHRAQNRLRPGPASRRRTHAYPNVSGFRIDTWHCKTARTGHMRDTFPALNTPTARPDASHGAAPAAGVRRHPVPANTFRSIRHQEIHMNASKFTFALAALATTASVYAASPAEPITGNQGAAIVTQWTPAASMPKTRSEVRHELALARQNGELDALRKLYSGH